VVFAHQVLAAPAEIGDADVEQLRAHGYRDEQILIDATLARAVLLPAAMKLLGDANWYLPERLAWLPKLEHEPEVTPAIV
jgi:hypothetical protein